VDKWILTTDLYGTQREVSPSRLWLLALGFYRIGSLHSPDYNTVLLGLYPLKVSKRRLSASAGLTYDNIVRHTTKLSANITNFTLKTVSEFLQIKRLVLHLASVNFPEELSYN